MAPDQPRRVTPPGAAQGDTGEPGTILLRRDGQPPLRLRAALLMRATQSLPGGQVAEIALWRRRKGTGFAVSATIPGPAGPCQQAWSVANAEAAMARIEALADPAPANAAPARSARRKQSREPVPGAADAAELLARRARAREEQRVMGHLAGQVLARLDQEFTAG